MINSCQWVPMGANGDGDFWQVKVVKNIGNEIEHLKQHSEIIVSCEEKMDFMWKFCEY